MIRLVTNTDDMAARGVKEVRVNLRVREDVRQEFAAAAEAMGTTMSNVLHQYIVSYILKVRDERPKKFQEELNALKAKAPREKAA